MTIISYTQRTERTVNEELTFRLEVWDEGTGTTRKREFFRIPSEVRVGLLDAAIAALPEEDRKQLLERNQGLYSVPKPEPTMPPSLRIADLRGDLLQLELDVGGTKGIVEYNIQQWNELDAHARVFLSADWPGLTLIANERIRQIRELNYDDEHDNAHESDELAVAAALYATPERLYMKRLKPDGVAFLDPWLTFLPGWDDTRPRDESSRSDLLDNDTLSLDLRIRQLTKAGALIAAEIDRLQRKVRAEEE